MVVFVVTMTLYCAVLLHSFCHSADFSQKARLVRVLQVFLAEPFKLGKIQAEHCCHH